MKQPPVEVERASLQEEEATVWQLEELLRP
jgi:hypothetical protein